MWDRLNNAHPAAVVFGLLAVGAGLLVAGRLLWP